MYLRVTVNDRVAPEPVPTAGSMNKIFLYIFKCSLFCHNVALDSRESAPTSLFGRGNTTATRARLRGREKPFVGLPTIPRAHCYANHIPTMGDTNKEDNGNEKLDMIHKECGEEGDNQVTSP